MDDTEQLAMTGDGRRPPHHDVFQVQIDRVHYTVDQAQLTGAQLRQIPRPPIGPDRDLFEVIPGQPDRQIDDSDVVEMHNGLRFFTAPDTINPGSVGC